MDTSGLQRVEKAWVHNPTGAKVALVSGRGPRQAPDIWEAEPGESIQIPSVYVPAAIREGFAAGKTSTGQVELPVVAEVKEPPQKQAELAVSIPSSSDDDLAASLKKRK